MALLALALLALALYLPLIHTIPFLKQHVGTCRRDNTDCNPGKIMAKNTKLTQPQWTRSRLVLSNLEAFSGYIAMLK
jgi:hypothetical protein